jgi:hypothetical protein
MIPDCMPETLLVGDLKRPQIDVDFVLCTYTLSYDLQVQFPHAPKHGLPSLGVKGDAQPWVLSLQFSECALQCFLSTLQTQKIKAYEIELRLQTLTCEGGSMEQKKTGSEEAPLEPSARSASSALIF